jgi:hypothetical protein
MELGLLNRQDNDGYLQKVENRLSERTLSESNGANKLRCGKSLSLMPAQSLSHNTGSVTKGEMPAIQPIIAPVCLLTEHGF